MRAKTTAKRADAELQYKADLTRAELISSTTKKLGRPLTRSEQNQIRQLDNSFLVSGYYKKLFRGYDKSQLLDWFSTVAKTRNELVKIQQRRDAITRTQIKHACSNIIQIVTASLGRALTTDEEKVIFNYDRQLLVDGDIARLFQGYSQQQLIDHFSEAIGSSGSVALLNSLATGQVNLESYRNQILRFSSPKGRKAVERFDIQTSLESFTKWLLGLLRLAPLPVNIRALNFGLFEGDNGYNLYVTGSAKYNRHNPDWVCTTEWCPDGRYAPLFELHRLYQRLHKTEREPWVVAQAITILLIRAFFKQNAQEFKMLTGKQKLFVASGFDDGDLYLIKTEFSPKD